MTSTRSLMRRLSRLEKRLLDRQPKPGIRVWQEEASNEELAGTLQVIDELDMWVHLPHVFSALPDEYQQQIRDRRSRA